MVSQKIQIRHIRSKKFIGLNHRFGHPVGVSPCAYPDHRATTGGGCPYKNRILAETKDVAQQRIWTFYDAIIIIPGEIDILSRDSQSSDSSAIHQKGKPVWYINIWTFPYSNCCLNDKN
jgi:hypothetical protein